MKRVLAKKHFMPVAQVRVLPMALDATVGCTCYEKGLTDPPPVPVTVDEEGYLAPQGDTSEEAERHFVHWLDTACPHPHMDYLSESFGNWAAYRSFLEVLEQVGWQHFPLLHQTLPTSNGGLTPAEISAGAVHELAELRRLRQDAVRPQLDSLMDEDLFAYVLEALERTFAASVETGNPVRWC